MQRGLPFPHIQILGHKDCVLTDVIIIYDYRSLGRWTFTKLWKGEKSSQNGKSDGLGKPWERGLSNFLSQ